VPEVTKRPGAIVFGAVLGAVCSSAIGILTQVVTQPFGELVIRPLGWLSLASVIPMPIGLVAGAIGASFLTVRARYVRAFQRLRTEATALGGAMGLVMVAFYTYREGEMPATLNCVLIGGGAASAFLIASVLRSNYWHHPSSPDRPASLQ
jgi:hypothetical protein